MNIFYFLSNIITCLFYIISINIIKKSLSTSDINPYKDIQKILSEDFNPHLPKAEKTVLPWKMNFSYKEKKILEFDDKSEFPLHEICACSLEEVNEMESNILFGSGAI